MSENDEKFADPVEPPIPSELELLKETATKLGIEFHPAIGVVKLKARVNEKMGIEPEEKIADTPEPGAEPKTVAGPVAKKDRPILQKSIQQLKQEANIQHRKDAFRLVRVVVANMNPNKKDWAGEIFTVSNSVVGTVKKFVPFNVDAGYHIPHIIYEQLLVRQYQAFVKKRLPGGQTSVKGKLVPEFHVKVLDNLSREEMKALATRQGVNHSIDEA